MVLIYNLYWTWNDISFSFIQIVNKCRHKIDRYLKYFQILYFLIFYLIFTASGIFSCTSCQPYLTLDGGMCLECPTGQYYNISQAKCDHCHESCLTCKGSHFNQCLSCQAPYSLHQETSTCQTCCKESIDETKNGDCCECLPETGNVFMITFQFGALL